MPLHEKLNPARNRPRRIEPERSGMRNGVLAAAVETAKVRATSEQPQPPSARPADIGLSMVIVGMETTAAMGTTTTPREEEATAGAEGMAAAMEEEEGVEERVL